MITCSKCNIEQPKEEFGKHKRQCRTCRREYQKKYYISNEDYRLKHVLKNKTQESKLKAKDTELKRIYGITLEEYNKVLEEQEGVCKICKCSDPVRRLAVDHDHATGKVRGLLCNNCNRGLGHLKDDPKILTEAIKYLEYYNIDRNTKHG